MSVKIGTKVVNNNRQKWMLTFEFESDEDNSVYQIDICPGTTSEKDWIDLANGVETASIVVKGDNYTISVINEYGDMCFNIDTPFGSSCYSRSYHRIKSQLLGALKSAESEGYLFDQHSE